MGVNDIVSALIGIASLFLLWDNNRAIREGNKRPLLINGGKMSSPSNKRWIKNNWRLLTMFVLIGSYCSVTIYDIRDRHTNATQPANLAFTTAPATRPWQEMDAVIGKSFWGEKVLMDGKDFVDCKFADVTLQYDGTADTELRNCTITMPIKLTSYSRGIVEYNDLFSYFGRMASSTGGVSFHTDVDQDGNPVGTPGSWGSTRPSGKLP